MPHENATPPFPVWDSLLCNGFEIGDNIADGDELLVVLFIDLNVEFGLTAEDQVGKLKRIDAEIGDELRFWRDIGGIDVHLLNEQVFELFKHDYTIILSLRFSDFL